MNEHIGVIVGRFQVPELHRGHRHVIDTALAQSDRVIICIGDTGGYPTQRHPLTYEMRRRMVLESYPHATVAMIRDQWNGIVWSRLLDQIIAEHMSEDAVVHLFGSRDSFLTHYVGEYQSVAVAVVNAPSGTDLRQMIAEGLYGGSSGERAGQILYQMNRPPLTYPTADIAVVDYANMRVLLGAKVHDGALMRFVGGFVDATDTSYAAAALRELSEEVPGIAVGAPIMIGSTSVDDPRYRDSDDAVMTTLFCVPYESGVPQSGDDLDRVAWVAIDALPEILITIHRPLGEMLLVHLDK